MWLFDVYVKTRVNVVSVCFFFFQAEDGIRDAQESRGLGDVYKRQPVQEEHVKTFSSVVACSAFMGV